MPSTLADHRLPLAQVELPQESRGNGGLHRDDVSHLTACRLHLRGEVPNTPLVANIDELE